jgi:hypothetical protein
MRKYSKQIERIKLKLPQAAKIDKDLKVFGAGNHHYILNKPAETKEVTAFEKKYSITLPDCYKSFVLQVGNGGKGYANSGAGPYYGIYPLGTRISDLVYEDTEEYLKKECILFPKMTDKDWANITKKIDGMDTSDHEYAKEVGRIFSGILPLGSQGCTYLHGLVLNGEYKGKVVNLDIDIQKPVFTFENNFLDWYERWLDEVISRHLIIGSPSWFGYSMGG